MNISKKSQALRVWLFFRLILFNYLCFMKISFLFIGGPEIFVILLIVIMFFGADKLPEIARGLGKGCVR